MHLAPREPVATLAPSWQCARVPHRAGAANERTCSTLRRVSERTHAFHTAPAQANMHVGHDGSLPLPTCARVPHCAGASERAKTSTTAKAMTPHTRCTLRRSKRVASRSTRPVASSTSPRPRRPSHDLHTAPEQARDLSEHASRRHHRALADLHTPCTPRRSRRVASPSARRVDHIAAPSPSFARPAHRAGAGAWPLRAPVASTTSLRPRRASHDLRTAPELRRHESVIVRRTRWDWGCRRAGGTR